MEFNNRNLINAGIKEATTKRPVISDEPSLYGALRRIRTPFPSPSLPHYFPLSRIYTELG
jgi:hypothetical protein